MAAYCIEVSQHNPTKRTYSEPENEPCIIRSTGHLNFSGKTQTATDDTRQLYHKL